MFGQQQSANSWPSSLKSKATAIVKEALWAQKFLKWVSKIYCISKYYTFWDIYFFKSTYISTTILSFKFSNLINWIFNLLNWTINREQIRYAFLQDFKLILELNLHPVSLPFSFCLVYEFFCNIIFYIQKLANLAR